MKFGAVPVEKALGAILAHSVQLTGGRLRKGAVVSKSDQSALMNDGVTEIVVARLEADDLAENDAAERLASAIADPEKKGLSATNAFTGRVNLRAEVAGVVRVDADSIRAFNSVNPMITIATVPDYHLADARTMLATIKIISFGVPSKDVEAARLHLAEAIRIRQPVVRNASLIVTEIPGVASAKGIEAIKQRLVRWGVALDHVVFCAHRQDALEEALAGVSSELVLILTGSATSDIADVAPASVVGAGGRIERFGMPVDPGNLLFLGVINDTPVIGLPGCARSPALNGTDWVLARVACGVGVSASDISDMGVGGLLKEIPTRPQPRSRHGK